MPHLAHPCAHLEVAFLGSGSSGNATFIASGDDALLIDAGFSARETLRRIAEAGADATHVRAILVTHEHTDHVSGVRVLAKRLDVPVYATSGTWSGIRQSHEIEDRHRIVPGEELRIGTLEVLAFRTSHDAAEPVGYRVTGSCGTSFGLMTDTGVATPEALEALAGCDLLGIETNHDERMLENGPYPYFLKQRIASDRGHLSNAAAMAALETLAHDGLRMVMGLHLSQENNAPTLVARTLEAALARIGVAAASGPVAQHVCTLPTREGTRAR